MGRWIILARSTGHSAPLRAIGRAWAPPASNQGRGGGFETCLAHLPIIALADPPLLAGFEILLPP